MSNDPCDDSAEPIDTPHLESAPNFRDVAGTGCPITVPAGHLRPGVYYRSGSLHLSEPDQQILLDLGVTLVVDLRTKEEIASDPDLLPKSIRYVNVDVLGAGGAEAQGANIQSLHVTTKQQAVNYMVSANKAFVEDSGVRGALGKAFQLLADSSGSAVFHCTGGKDRTGWVAAVLQLNAGASESQVIDNYVLTNKFLAPTLAAAEAQIAKSQGQAIAEAYLPLMHAEPPYLEAGLGAMTANYGGVQNYLEEGLGLATDTVATLRSRLLEGVQK